MVGGGTGRTDRRLSVGVRRIGGLVPSRGTCGSGSLANRGLYKMRTGLMLSCYDRFSSTLQKAISPQDSQRKFHVVLSDDNLEALLPSAARTDRYVVEDGCGGVGGRLRTGACHSR